MVTAEQVNEYIYNGDSTKEELLEMLNKIHDRFADCYYEFAPEPMEQQALDLIKKTRISIQNSNLV